MQQCAAFAVGLAVIRGSCRGVGYLVVGVEVEELDAHGGADLLGVR